MLSKNSKINLAVYAVSLLVITYGFSDVVALLVLIGAGLLAFFTCLSIANDIKKLDNSRLANAWNVTASCLIIYLLLMFFYGIGGIGIGQEALMLLVVGFSYGFLCLLAIICGIVFVARSQDRSAQGNPGKIITVGLAVVIAICLVALAVVRFSSGSEDDWICENGQWIKHGHPSAPMPSVPCAGHQPLKASVEKSPDSLRISSPIAGSLVKSPLVVSGEASGWYFEAVFSVRVTNEQGITLGSGQAQAQGDWMTTAFVPFSGSIVFDPKDSQKGFVVFEKSNPSGLEQNALSYSFPVNFAGN